MICKTEDEVRNETGRILGLDQKEQNVQQGTGQITTFNQLGFSGTMDKPDGWYLPNNHENTAIIIETKAEAVSIDTKKCVEEIKKNCAIAMQKYPHVVGVLTNGKDTRVYMNNNPVDAPKELQSKQYYIDMFKKTNIDKEKILR